MAKSLHLLKSSNNYAEGRYFRFEIAGREGGLPSLFLNMHPTFSRRKTGSHDPYQNG